MNSTHRTGISKARRGGLAACIVILVVGATGLSQDASPRIVLRFSAKEHPASFTGRVLLFLSQRSRGEPRENFGWTSREPVYSMEVKNWQPDEPLEFVPTKGYPIGFEGLRSGKYRLQAVMHLNPDLPHSGDAPGNLYSGVIERELPGGEAKPLEIVLDRKARSEGRPIEMSLTRTIEMRSGLLSAFHHRDVMMRAVVSLPGEFETEPKRKFAAIYGVPGFGGDHFQAASYLRTLGLSKSPFVRVGLDGMCANGHHVYADSDVNGPWGRALIEEFIPHLEKEFRLIADPGGRFVVGHSSGGWSALWLQVAYPDFFGGVWAVAPDSVSFDDFSGTNLYEPGSNCFIDADGRDRPIMRRSQKVLLTFRDFSRLEDVLGPGGQLYSFEAVFGPRREDGSPRPMFDRTTGNVDPETLRYWQRYDICRKVTREWEMLGIKLQGKIHVLMGGDDNFYLDGATRKLKKLLFNLGSDARVIIVEGRDHGTIMLTEKFHRIIEEMDERFTNWLRDHAAATQVADDVASPGGSGQRAMGQRSSATQPRARRPAIGQRPAASRPAASRPDAIRGDSPRPMTSGSAGTRGRN